MKKHIFILIAVTFISVRLPGAGDEKNTAVQTVTVKRKNIGASILATGSVKPVIGAEVKVGSRVSGKVEHLYANIGNRVEKDQIIAEIEKNELEAQTAQLKAAIALHEARLSALENQLPKAVGIARTNVESAKALQYPQVSLVASSNYGGITYDLKGNALAGLQIGFPLYSNINKVSEKRAKNELELTEATYDDNRKIILAEISQAKAALAQAEVQLSYATIKAPISGVIAAVMTQEGETIAAGLNAPTFVTIIDLSRLQVDAFVDETDIGRVKTGQKALFTVDTYPDMEFTGRVRTIYPKAIIHENVVNFDVVIEIEGRDTGLLRPDMTTSVTIYQQEKKGSLVIPRPAIIREGKNKFALVKTQSGAFEKRAIKTGIQSGNDVEVISGVKEGDIIGIK